MTRRELAHWARQPVQVIVNLAFPVLLLLMFGYLIGGGRGVDGDYLDFLFPGMLALTTDSATQILFRRQEAASLQDARARGIDFRAVGQEPAWVVELKKGETIKAVLDYGATTLELPTPSGQSAADGLVTYDASTDTDHLVLNIMGKICVDAMSGESHPSTVELLVNDKPYRGCGDWLD